MDEFDRESRMSIGSSEDNMSQDSSAAAAASLSNADAEENYYSVEMDDENLTSVAALEETIEQVRSLVLHTEGISEDRRKLVKRLIELRLRLQEVKDTSNDGNESPDALRIVNNHHFVLQKQPLHRSALYCDKCSTVIWTILQVWYKCKGCSYLCHSKCLNQVIRVCQCLKVSNDAKYICDICPESGLPAQNYKCAECKAHLTLKSSWMEPRRCDYDGKYYCPLCHKNSTMSVPARIIHNWDFEPRPVSESNRQYLTLMFKKPNIHLEKLNPRLFYFVADLNAVKRIREDIIVMKQYFITCREASSKKMLRLLDGRQHFVDNSYMFSLQDLVDVQNEVLIKFLEKVYATFVKHIKDECTTCRGKGFICEICGNVHVIFPFDSATHQCPTCFAVYHNICFAKRETCPKCLRLSHRKSTQEETISLLKS